MLGVFCQSVPRFWLAGLALRLWRAFVALFFSVEQNCNRLRFSILGRTTALSAEQRNHGCELQRIRNRLLRDAVQPWNKETDCEASEFQGRRESRPQAWGGLRGI